MKATSDAAMLYLKSGLSAIPTRRDKAPACRWSAYQERIMGEREAELFFANAEGIGIVTGKVSGNLELLDFDDRGSRFESWFGQVPPYIRKRLVVETSPSGGKHVYFRVKSTADHPFEVPGNRKLAMKADGSVLIETRGEGGYVKCAPSEGYRLEQGDFGHMPEISALEEGILIDAAKELDETSRAVKEVPSPARLPSICDSIDIRPYLERHGWRKVRADGKNEHWERPGKSEGSTSATFDGDVFYVFSSNAAPFEANQGYSKKRVLALLGETPFVEESLAKCGGETPPPLTQPTARGTEAIPDELLHVPGFIDAMADYTLSSAPYPNRPLAFAGALAMLAHLSGRNFKDAAGLRTNIYLLALANSGVGKDFPRKVNMKFADALGIVGGMANRFASAEGLEDSLLVHPCSFYQVDEVDTLFATLDAKGESSVEKIYGSLLEFATSADGVYTMRKKALGQGGKPSKFEKLRENGIKDPHLVLLGTAIPKYLYSALSERAMENGLISRCLVIEAGKRGLAGNSRSAPFPAELMAMGESLVARGGFEGMDLDSLQPVPNPEPYTVAETEEAAEARAAVVRTCDNRYDERSSESEKALWSRAAEKTARLALLYAISENVDSPVITGRAFDWAWRFVEYATERTLHQASVYVHDSKFDELRKKALRFLKEKGHGRMKHRDLLRGLGVDADMFRKVLETLFESELIVARPLKPKGFEYFLAEMNGAA